MVDFTQRLLKNHKKTIIGESVLSMPWVGSEKESLSQT